MTEKVIKGLETCYRIPGKCEDCPYHDLPDEQSCNDALCLDALALLKELGEQIKNRDESLEKAREEIKWLRGMLKEQEAIEPRRIDGKRNHFIKCGNCNCDLLTGYMFCPHCGKAVKWDG